MLEYNPNKALLSIHIPKTAGSSFRYILTNWFGEKLYLHYFNERDSKIPEKHILAPRICIHGHFNLKRGFGITQYYPQAKQFIAFLRDPFEILISRYFYVKMREKVGVSFRNGKLISLPDNVNEFLLKEVSNPDYSPNILDYFPEVVSSHNYKDIIDKYFIMIGFLDYYQQSVKCISNLLGFPAVDIPFKNKSERFDEINPFLKELFISEHKLEYETYKYAREKFLPIIKSC
jgi:hypothetical protein